MCAADQAMLTDASNGLFVADVHKAHKLIRLILMKDKRLGHFKSDCMGFHGTRTCAQAGQAHCTDFVRR